LGPTVPLAWNDFAQCAVQRRVRATLIIISLKPDLPPTERGTGLGSVRLALTYLTDSRTILEDEYLRPERQLA